MMKMLMDRIVLNKYKNSKNPFKQIYYYIKVKQIIRASDKFIRNNDVLNANVLLNFLSICRMTGYVSGAANDSFRWNILFLDYDETHYASIKIVFKNTTITISINLINPEKIDLEYFDKDKDVKFKYSLALSNNYDKVKARRTDISLKIFRTNFILKDCIENSMREILTEV